MKPQPQGHAFNDPYHQEDIKPDAVLGNKARSPSQYQDRDNMSYSEKEALNQLPEASSWPKFSGTGEFDHMELIYYIDGLLIDVPSIPDYWITARLNTEFKGHASIWYIEMKEINGRRNWPCRKNQIIQKYSIGTWIWKNTMSFENGKYSVDKDSYEWCPKQFERLKAIDPQVNSQMRNHKLLTQTPGELEHAVKCRCNQSCTLDDIENTLQDFKDKPRERVAEVAKKKNTCYNCGSTDHYSNNCPKEKKKVDAIQKVPEEESPTENSESDSMGDSIRKQSDDDQDPREEFLVDYQEETQIEIQEIQLEAGMPKDTANKSFSKEKNLKSASGKIKSIGTIIKDIIIPHRRGNIRLNPEFVVPEDAHIQGFLLGTDYQSMYGIDIYNSKNRHIVIGTNKEKEFSLDIHQISTHDALEEPLNELRECQFSTTLTSISVYKLCSKDLVFEITKDRRAAYERIKYELTNAPVLILPDFELPFKLYIDADCSQGLGAAVHQRQIVDGEPREGVICYISRKLKYSEARYGATQTECLCLVWALEKLHYYLEGTVFEIYTECTALKSLLKMKTTNRQMLGWKIAIREYRGNMTIIYKEGNSHTNADDLSRWPVDNVKRNPAYDPEVSTKIPIHFMQIDRRKNFRFSE
ncbi:hypothetical protein O181_034616 [Austropuccinia psidii MF-1]|uniref:CCHC-type domain-containing protein n=1 Tax=Austropuccinia psidii MF-1 TaxID=1389203 RepID=A0A9Q3D6Q4_9BASI|nr:hypothetical protein [Austropuccinia psidii MF-1]